MVATIYDSMEIFLTFMAVITLCLGGIGVMNIMLVSVSERTREIGVKQAVGASRERILVEFFLEAVVLTLVSGIGGLLFGGWICSFVGHLPLPPLFSGLPVTPMTAIIAFATLVLVGMLSGIYPARRASLLTPVEALALRMIRYIFNEAIGALAHYRLRSLLTMLSIVWGITSLMLLLSYGEGFDRALTRAFLQIGKDLVVAFPGQTSMQAGGERSGRRIRLELSDVTAIQESVPTVEAISPEVRRNYPISYGYRTRDYSAIGVYSSFERIRNMEIALGRFLSEEDVFQRQRVVVIGDNVRKELFSGMPALGNEIKINGVRFAVIGVLKKKTQISNYTSPDDMNVYMPFTTLLGHDRCAVPRQYRSIARQQLVPISHRARRRAALARAAQL